MKRIDEFSFHTLENAPDAGRLIWETTSRNRVYETPIFGVNRVHRKSQDGREGDFVEIDSPQWVNVVPYFVGSDGVPRFIMERQFRHGSDSVTLEFPAGLVEKGESPRDAGLRELEEETGLVAHSFKFIGSVCPNSAFMNNEANFFLAEDLELVHSEETRKLDANESIDIISIPVAEVLDKLGTDEMDNGIMLMSGFFFLREAKKRGLALS